MPWAAYMLARMEMGGVVFVAARGVVLVRREVPRDDPALLLALVLALRGGGNVLVAAV